MNYARPDDMSSSSMPPTRYIDIIAFHHTRLFYILPPQVVTAKRARTKCLNDMPK